MKPVKYLPIVAVATVLGACAATAQQDLNVSEVRNLPQQGDSFHQALHSGYVALAQIEKDEADTKNTDYFNTKARQAAANSNVSPMSLDEREIAHADYSALNKGREDLMRVLDRNGATQAPLKTARAQTQFDCWMEEQGEPDQLSEIKLCREGFEAAMVEANAAVLASGAPLPQPNAQMPLVDVASYTIYFDHNSSSFNRNASATNKEIIDIIKTSHATGVTVNGYTDRSGSVDYNRLLAERRTATVTDAIVSSGIKPTVVYQSFGENNSAVNTGDDVRNWENRRVVVIVQK